MNSRILNILLLTLMIPLTAGLVWEFRKAAWFEAENTRLQNESAGRIDAPTADDQIRGAIQSGNGELLKLRSEVARLKRELSSVASNPGRATIKPKIDVAEGSPSTSEEENFKLRQLAVATGLKNWLVAMMMHASDHEGQLPSDFKTAEAYLPADASISLNLDKFAIWPQGNLRDIKHPDKTVIMIEKEPRIAPDGKTSRAVGFADGHVELTSGEIPISGIFE